MKIKVIAASALGLLAFSLIGPARSQDTAQPVLLTQAPQGITVQGHSEIKEKPDIARVTLTVTTNNRNSAQSVQQNAERTSAALTALQGIGIAGKDVETLSYTVQPTFDYTESPPKRKGYQVQNSIQVTIHDLTKVGLAIDGVTSAGGAEIGEVSFDVSDRAQAQAQALGEAVASAKLKAGAMASAAGVDLGRLLTMTEGASSSIAAPVPLYERRALYGVAGQAPQTPIASQQITLTADATLVYAMGPAK